MPDEPVKPLGEVFFEFRQVGGQLRVVAMHAASGTEVTLVAPTAAPRSQIQQIALQKLRRRLEQDGKL